jgi:hypothetical protein
LLGGVFLLLYIVLSTDGDVWIDLSLLVGSRASLALCITTFSLAVIERSKSLLIGAGLLLVLWVVGPVFGQIGCALGGLSGGYDRMTNCGLEIRTYTGLLAFSLVVALQGRYAVPIVLSAVLVVLVGFAGTHYFLSNALNQEIAAADLEIECFVLQPNYYASPFDKSSAARIWKVEDLQLGWVIGEQSPRIFRVAEGRTDVWKFSQRAFAYGGKYNGLAEFCSSEELS